MDRLFRTIQSPLKLLSILALLTLSFLPEPSPTTLAATRPGASRPFTLAEGPGNQHFPSLADTKLVYDDCPQPILPCKVKVLDVNTRQSYTLASTFRNGTPHTDGNRVVWTDRRNRAGSDEVLSASFSYHYIENGDVYWASLADNTAYPATKAFKLQDQAYVYGNIAVWADHRAAKDPDDTDASDIYMYDFNTGREKLISAAPLAQVSPVTNGRVIVWMDFRGDDLRGYDPSKVGLYVYDLATGRERELYRTPVARFDHIDISGNIIVWSATSRNRESSDIYGYDLSTGKNFDISTARGHQGSPRISGNLVVWEDHRANKSEEGGLDASDIYGYDLATKQEFPISVGGSMLHLSPDVSGGTVVWVDHPPFAPENQANIMGATITGITLAPTPPRPSSTTSRTFPETGKTVAGTFLDYWNKNGGLTQQGFPISATMNEVSDLNGKPYTVQYFERAVFEQHPENKAPYDVLLSHLGTFRYKAKYPGDIPPQGSNLPGAISGQVSFRYAYGTSPGNIYAIPVGGGDVFATATSHRQEEYSITGVAPGTYYVVAYFGETYDGVGASAYTQAVVDCGSVLPNQRCWDHSLVRVTVRPGQTTSAIDLVDTTLYTPLSVPGEPDPTARCQVFEETGRKLCGKFLQYWLLNGYLQQQGFPISDEMRETSDLDGKPYTVQYFERAQFELHPEKAGTPFEVLLSQLGTFQHRKKYPTSP